MSSGEPGAGEAVSADAKTRAREWREAHAPYLAALTVGEKRGFDEKLAALLEEFARDQAAPSPSGDGGRDAEERAWLWLHDILRPWIGDSQNRYPDSARQLAAEFRAVRSEALEEAARVAEGRMRECVHDGEPDAVTCDDDGKHVNGCSRCWEDEEVAEAIRALASGSASKGSPTPTTGATTTQDH